MTFASFVRIAVPRNVRLCAWSRNLAMNMQGARGLASTPLLRFVAEQRPPSGFAEQAVRGGCLGPAGASLGEVGSAIDSSAAELVAALLSSLADHNTTVSNSFSEMTEFLAQVGRRCIISPAHRSDGEQG